MDAGRDDSAVTGTAQDRVFFRADVPGPYGDDDYDYDYDYDYDDYDDYDDDDDLIMMMMMMTDSRAAHAHPTSPRSTGFCAIWDCISSSLR